MRPRARPGTRPCLRRALLLLALLTPVAALAGCLDSDDEERPLLVPTNSSVGIPRATPPVTPTVVYNFSDPGYVMEGQWRVGDGWDYESNRSNFRKVRVLDARFVNGTVHYLLEEKIGKVGNPSRGRTLEWVEGTNWTRLNRTDIAGTRAVFEPGQPLRFLKNGTYSYNVTFFDAGGTVRERHEVAANSRLVGRQTLLFPWGYVEAAKVEHRVSTRVGETITRTLVTGFVHRDYLNDVRYVIDDTAGNVEAYTLVAAQVGDLRRGTLRDA